MFIQLTEHMVSNRHFPAEACFELLGFDFILDEEQRCQSFHPNLREHIHTILLMEEILHQLRLVVYPMIYQVLYIRGGWEWDFFHQESLESCELIPGSLPRCWRLFLLEVNSAPSLSTPTNLDEEIKECVLMEAG